MKTVILAGGIGSRISEETILKPKPMIEINGKPILWHIMKIYSYYGYNDFIVCAGYKSHLIKEYFMNFELFNSDVTFDLINNDVTIHENRAEPWKVTIVETGDNTMTGGRLKRIKKYLNDSEDFFMTYGDGVSSVDINHLLLCHQKAGTLATVTGVKPPGRFGSLQLDNELVSGFLEKPDGDNAWINGGFFVLNPKVLDLIDGDQSVWELKPMKTLAEEGMLSFYRHKGFWQPMDTLREKNILDELSKRDKAPWEVWK